MAAKALENVQTITESINDLKNSCTNGGKDERSASNDDRAKLKALISKLELDTGDVVLFDRKCSKMSLYGMIICACAKYVGETQWDHNGVVYKNPQTNELMLLEATLTGVKVRPLVERIQRSSSYEVSVRKLQVQRDGLFYDKAQEFLDFCLNSPYESNVHTIINAQMQVPTRIEREELFHQLVGHKKEIARLQDDLNHRFNMTKFEQNMLQTELENHIKVYEEIAKTLDNTERSFFENTSTPPLTVKNVFCSELVASFYQHLGALLPYPSANSYLPKHYSMNDRSNYMKFQNDVVLLPEISLRQKLDQNYHKFIVLEDTSTNSAVTCTNTSTKLDISALNHNSEAMNTILKCLRRHALFHSLSESELINIAKQFKKQVFQPGQIVFYQGTEGEYFYIIEKGSCDVLVNYENLASQDQNAAVAGKSAAGSTSATVTTTTSPSTNIAAQRRFPSMRNQVNSFEHFRASSAQVGMKENVIVATNGPSNAFGDSGLMYNTPRRATIRAKGVEQATKNHSRSNDSEENEVIVWKLDKQTFLNAIHKHPSSQYSLKERQFLMDAILNHPLFNALDTRAHALAARKFFPLHFKKNTEIIKQGDYGDYFYIIENGTCEINRKKPNSDKTYIDRVLANGMSFGEASLLYNSKRGANVIAKEDTKVWCMDRGSFLTITKSGSTGLLKIFNNIGSITNEYNETFMSFDDITNILKHSNVLVKSSNHSNHSNHSNLPKKLNVQNNLNQPNFQNNQNTATTTLPYQAVVNPVMELGAKEYANCIELAKHLLFVSNQLNMINFSQFAHFHICLHQSKLNSFVPEAMYRSISEISESKQLPLTCQHLPQLIQYWQSENNENGKEQDTNTHSISTNTSTTNQYASITPEQYLKCLQKYNTTKTNYTLQTVLNYSEFVSIYRAYSKYKDKLISMTTSNKYTLSPIQTDIALFINQIEKQLYQLQQIWQLVDFNHLRQLQNLDQNNNTTTSTTTASTMASYQYQLLPQGGSYLAYLPSYVHYYSNQLVSKTNLFWPIASAMVAGMLARTCTAPLERLKILRQLAIVPTSFNIKLGLHNNIYRAPLFTSFQRMWSIGGLRTLYSGNFIHCLKIIPSFPLKLIICDRFRSFIDQSNQSMYLFPVEIKNIVAGGMAGATVNSLIYPLDVVRGRLTGQEFLTSSRKYTSLTNCIQTMVGRFNIWCSGIVCIV